MKARRNEDSDADGDLVDPSFGNAGAPNSSKAPGSGTPSQSHVIVGGGEREARAYVGPTALPNIAVPKAAADKVAISSSVDPRRMQTMRLSPGRIRPPLNPDERPAAPIDIPGAPSTPYPPSSHAHSGQRAPMSTRTPPSSMPSSAAASGPPVLLWVLAVALAALIGAGVALWLRRAPAPAEAPPPAPTTTKR